MTSLSGAQLNSDQLHRIIRLQAAVASEGLDLNRIMNLVVDDVVSLLDCDGAVIELVDDDWLLYAAVAGRSPDLLGLRLSRSGSLSGLCLAQNALLHCRDAHTDPRVDPRACAKVGLRSMLVLPLHFREETVGVLKALSATPDHFRDADAAVLEQLCSSLSAALYYASRYSDNNLFWLATHDGLTGLANRVRWLEQLHLALERRQADARIGVVLLDLDGLKRINDHWGHSAGDLALQAAGERISAVVAERGLVARLSGDEFAVLLPELSDAHPLSALMAAIEQAMQQPLLSPHGSLPLASSAGAACLPDDASSIGTLLELADQRLYANKRQRQQQQQA